MTIRNVLLSSALLGASVLAGCGGPGYMNGYYGPPPPAPYYGPVGVAPGPGYVWMGGYWDRDGDRWHWRDGRWGRGPRGYRHYESPRWERHGGHYRFREGHWRR